MNTKRLRFAYVTIPLFAVAALTVAAVSPHRNAVIDQACNNTLPCIEYDNSGIGPGVRGTSVAGNGLSGSTKNKSTSVANGRAGLMGNDQGTGRFNSGVHGLSVDGTGVSGASTNGTGTFGSGASFGAVGIGGSAGIYGDGSTFGAYGLSDAGDGVRGVSTSGIGIYASSHSGRAVEGHTSSGLGLYITDGRGNGADLTGTYIGVVSRATSFPIVATDLAGSNLFYVDGSGNVFYHGSLGHFAATRSGKTVVTYGATTAGPSVEDTGSGQLVNGVAMVSLDPAFAQTIDLRTIYHVMLTSDGDTRGLYVASKGPRGFVVREVQGGHGSLTFDYHIYATALGHAGERMTVMTDAQTRATSPNAPLVPARPVPALRLLPLRPLAEVTR